MAHSCGTAVLTARCEPCDWFSRKPGGRGSAVAAAVSSFVCKYRSHWIRKLMTPMIQRVKMMLIMGDRRAACYRMHSTPPSSATVLGNCCSFAYRCACVENTRLVFEFYSDKQCVPTFQWERRGWSLVSAKRLTQAYCKLRGSDVTNFCIHCH